MGGDEGPPVTVPAALRVLAQYPTLRLILVGNRSLLLRELASRGISEASRLQIQQASETVGMDESPAQALRTKKDSSMRVAINLVKDGRADACVSAGNTGALMATARFVLKTLPGIDRPAIISSFPTRTGKKIRMLDLGANVDSTPENLLQFAIMGSVLVSAVDNIPHPKLCLLNIGVEDIKGNELVKRTAELLSNSPGIHYVGFMEADAIYDGEMDVLVADGFSGNVVLKSLEGSAFFIGDSIKEAFQRNFFTRLAGLVAFPVLKS